MVGFRAFTAADRDALIADPRAFMNSIACQVAQSVCVPSVRGRPDRLTFRFIEGHPHAYRLGWTANGTDVTMTRVPFFELRKAADGEVAFDAYIVEYVAGTTPQTTLGTDAQLAFTANMNGCTFGIGSQANAESALVVTHSNSVGHGSQAANALDQHDRALGVVGQGGTLLEPSSYRTHDKMAVTFGYRSAGQLWRFAYLSYRRAQNRITTYGVVDVAAQRLQV